MFSIANYDKLYRPYDRSGGELKHPDFVKLPVNPKGDGLQKLLKYKRGLEVFAVWSLLLEKTTAEKKPENRGRLLNHQEQPASPAEIANGISLPKKERLVTYALSVLTAMGWLVDTDKPTDKTEETSADFRKLPPKISKVKTSKGKYSEQFIKFWDWYPPRWIKSSNRRVKIGKEDAWQEWQKLTVVEQDLALEAVKQEKTSEIIPDAHRWLAHGRFADYEKPDKERETLIEARRREKQKEEIRKEYGNYFQGQSIEKLEEGRKSKTLSSYWFLIDEILAEKRQQVV